jgi:hypothetical protein
MFETNYEAVKYNPEHKKQVIELQKHLWSPDVDVNDVNAAYFEWKYERNPYMDSPFLSLALYEGRVVGMGGMFGAKWQIGNPSQTFLCPRSVDSLVAPDHRGHRHSKKKKQIFEKVREERRPYIKVDEVKRVSFLRKWAVEEKIPRARDFSL